LRRFNNEKCHCEERVWKKKRKRAPVSIVCKYWEKNMRLRGGRNHLDHHREKAEIGGGWAFSSRRSHRHRAEAKNPGDGDRGKKGMKEKMRKKIVQNILGSLRRISLRNF